MSTTADKALTGLRDRLRRGLPTDALATVDNLHASLPAWEFAAKFVDLGSAFRNECAAAKSRLQGSVLVDANRLFVAELALGLKPLLAQRRIPEHIAALAEPALDRLFSYLQNSVDASYIYPNDYFIKDVRFAAGMTIACGAEVLDLRSTLGVRGSAHLMYRRPSLENFWDFMTSARIDPWFRIHTESRYLRYFHETGWDEFYLRVASMLQCHPEVHGVIGTSWFFDPQLELISPRLNYLRNPIDRGAFLVRGKTSEFDIVSATGNSASRRQQYETGQYIPVPYTLVWPRAQLLRWAGSHRAVGVAGI